MGILEILTSNDRLGDSLEALKSRIITVTKL